MSIIKKRIIKLSIASLVSVSLLALSTLSQEAGAVELSATVNPLLSDALNTPTSLTIWSWDPGIQNQVNIFTSKYPKITVNVVNAGSGTSEYNNLRADLISQTGLPDVAQLEYQILPNFKALGALANIAPYLARNWSSQFPNWLNSQVSDGKGGIFAVPQDSGPMALFYRADTLAKYNLVPPKTWTEFAADAAIIHQSDPTSYLADLVTNPGNMNGLYWQAGSRPFHLKSAKSINIKLNDAATKRVSKFWGDLVLSGNISVDQNWTTEWNAGFNSGKYASWPSAAWAVGSLASMAPNTSGKWHVAALPTWGSSPASGNWGGSSLAVISASKHLAAAAALADFINTNPATSLVLTQAPTFDFPATNYILNSSAYKSATSPFFGGQNVNQAFINYNNTVDKNFEWSPFQDQVYDFWNNSVLDAILNKRDTAAAVDNWQADVVAYARNQGFTVTTN